MKVHEYQAKQILNRYGIQIPQGGIVYTPGEALRTAHKIAPHGPWVLKAQIHSGARGQGHFLERRSGRKSGIRRLGSREDVFAHADQMLGATLVTPQTGPKGRLVSKIYVEEYIPTVHHFYASLVIDRMVPCVTLLVSTCTTDLIDRLMTEPQTMMRLNLDADLPIGEEQSAKVIEYLHLDPRLNVRLNAFLNNMFRAFTQLDAVMMEINPVGVDKEGRFVALDAKLMFDDHALYRHADILRMHDDYEDDERVLKAAKYGFQYHDFDQGSIGCLVNGDGLALIVSDLLEGSSEAVACTLNVKGGVDKDKIAEGIKILMSNPRVEGILIDILGGFLRCDLVADGLVAAASEVGLTVPLAVRLEGTNKEEARQILARSSLPVMMLDTLEECLDVLLTAMRENN
jgi:succinyl-CoA synthetase beta subunit